MPDASPSLAGTAVYAHASNYQSCNRQNIKYNKKKQPKTHFHSNEKKIYIITPREYTFILNHIQERFQIHCGYNCLCCSFIGIHTAINKKLNKLFLLVDNSNSNLLDSFI